MAHRGWSVPVPGRSAVSKSCELPELVVKCDQFSFIWSSNSWQAPQKDQCNKNSHIISILINWIKINYISKSPRMFLGPNFRCWSGCILMPMDAFLPLRVYWLNMFMVTLKSLSTRVDSLVQLIERCPVCRCGDPSLWRAEFKKSPLVASPQRGSTTDTQGRPIELIPLLSAPCVSLTFGLPSVIKAKTVLVLFSHFDCSLRRRRGNPPPKKIPK